MAPPARIFRLKLKCNDLAEYSSKYASRFEGDFFVPSEKPVQLKDVVEVHLIFADDEVKVRGKAVVVRTDEVKGRKGLRLRFTDHHTRTTGAFEAHSDVDGATEFDDPQPTVTSDLSREIAETLKDEEPEIVIEGIQAGVAGAEKANATEEPAFDDSESDFGDIMGDDQKVPSALPKAKVAPEPRPAPAPAPEAEPEPPVAPPKSAHVQEAIASTTSGSSAKLWIAGGLVAAAAAAALVITMQSDKSPAKAAKTATPTATVQETPEQVEASAQATRIREAIWAADKRVAAGHLTGPESALEGLLAAKKLVPDHTDVLARLGALADKFEALATAANEAGNLAEAAAHLQAAILADPDRTELAEQMKAIEDQVRKQAP